MLGIHEAFYDGELIAGQKPHSITQDPVAVQGEDTAEAEEMYDMMAEAFKQPILEFNDIAR